MNWKYMDTNRPVKYIRTNRTIINESGIIRFKTIDRLPKLLQEQVSISPTEISSPTGNVVSSTTVPSGNYLPYIDFYNLIFENKKYVYIENINKQYSFFDIKILNDLFKDLSIGNNCSVYLKFNNAPLVIKYKGYYYMLNAVEYGNLSLTDMLENNMISIC